MKSTQRSESMHAFFDGYITSTSTLKTFVEQYEIAISVKVMKEMEQDYKSKCVFKARISHFKWEDQMGNVYTNRVMDLFQEEIKKLWDCNVSDLEVPNGDALRGIERYNVHQKLPLSEYFHKEYNFTVEYRSTGDFFSCDCNYFETRGILCCHILKVLVRKDFHLIPDRYILRRWRKDIYRPHSSILYSGGFPHLSEDYKIFLETEREFRACIDACSGKPQLMKDLRDVLSKMKDKANLYLASDGNIIIHGEEGGEPHVGDPDVVNRRGRPKTNRLKSAYELNANKRPRNTSSRAQNTSQPRASRGQNMGGSGGRRNANSRDPGNASSSGRGGGLNLNFTTCVRR